MNTDSFKGNSANLSNMEELVQIEKTRFLYQQSIPATVISLVIAAFMARVLWLHDGNSAVVIWFALMIIASIIRASVFVSFNRAQASGEAVLNWVIPYFLTLALSSAIWGIGGVIILPKDSLLYQAIVLYFMMGMCAGAMAVYSTNQSYALSTIYLILGPITIWSLFQDSYISVYMGLSSLTFLIAAARIAKIISSSQHDNFLRKYQLTEAEQKAATLAKTDSLTGLCNRLAFEEEANQILNIRKGYMDCFCLVTLGIDQLQKVNAEYGHDAGDEVLVKVAQKVKNAILDNDICARLDGDEFVILLPDAKNDMGILVAEKLNSEIGSIQHKHSGSDNGNHFSVSVSIGIAQGTDSLKIALADANKAMHQAKRAGRNQFVVF